jgi:aspartate carbamoyltransferase catalytic subunit
MRTTDAMREVMGPPYREGPGSSGPGGDDPLLRGLDADAASRSRCAAKKPVATSSTSPQQSSSVAKGESLVDTGRTVEALGAQMLVMRHAVSGARNSRPRIFGGSVLNGGDGWQAHPTQAAAGPVHDAGTAAGGSLAGRKVVILGDPAHSRVARSNIWTLTAPRRGPVAVWPATLVPRFEAWAGRGAASAGGSTSRPRSTRRSATRRRHGACGSSGTDGVGLLPSLREYAARYGLTASAWRSPTRTRSSCIRAR